MEALKIKIAKASQSIDITQETVNGFSPEVFQAIVAAGLEAILNKGMSKIGAVTKLEGEQKASAQAAALEIANKNLDKLKAGEVKASRSAAKSGVAREVMTEALRLAKNVVKDKIKAEGKKISHVAQSEITRVAKMLVEQDQTYITEATANIAERAKKPVGLDIGSLIQESPALVAKAAEKKAASKSQLSATQAGIAKTKGKVPPARGDHHTAH